MFAFSRFIPVAALTLLTACASLSAPMAATGAARPSSAASGVSAYGLFLAGQSAINNGQGDQAAGYFSRAAGQADAADAQLLQTHTFTAALVAGDVSQAAAVAPLADDNPVLRSLAWLTIGVEGMALDHGVKARAALTAGKIAPPHTVAAALLAPIAAAQAGDNEAAITLPAVNGDPVAQFFAWLDQGELFEHAGRLDEAETAYRALIARNDPGGMASANLAALLERRGRWTDAEAIYDQALVRLPGDPTLVEGKAAAAARTAPPAMPTLRQIAAEALVGRASELLAERHQDAALVYLRLALRLDSGHDTAWLLVGEILSEIGDASGARQAFMTPKPGSAAYATARGKLAWALQTDGKKDEALRVSRDVAEAEPSNTQAATTLADLLRADEKYQESVAVLDRVITGQGERPDWRLLYMRAIDYQQIGRWPEAERDITAALKQRPDEPELLNFLGYSWIDRGERLQEALGMVQKAVNADPKSGAMIDSLGWGYYRLGDFKTAVDKLEQAVLLEAGDPEVNDHLGDAYWRVGRRTEARFQWTRVLSLEPDGKTRTAVEAKLKNGLGPALGPLRGS